jgi:hypothetical protein
VTIIGTNANVTVLKNLDGILMSDSLPVSASIAQKKSNSYTTTHSSEVATLAWEYSKSASDNSELQTIVVRNPVRRWRILCRIVASRGNFCVASVFLQPRLSLQNVISTGKCMFERPSLSKRFEQPDDLSNISQTTKIAQKNVIDISTKKVANGV